jgi:hypothetical protein
MPARPTRDLRGTPFAGRGFALAALALVACSGVRRTGEGPLPASPRPAEGPPRHDQDAQNIVAATRPESSVAADETPQAWVRLPEPASQACVALEERDEAPGEWQARTGVAEHPRVVLDLRLRAGDSGEPFALVRVQLTRHRASGIGANGVGLGCDGSTPLFATEAACRASAPAPAVTACVEAALATLHRQLDAEERERAREQATFRARDPLLLRMRAGGDVWIAQNNRCERWKLAPEPGAPTRGSLERSRRLAGGAVETCGYSYRYEKPGRLVLAGPGGTRTHPNGDGSGWGVGDMFSNSVSHRPGGSQVGAAFWHETERSCREELGRMRRAQASRGEDASFPTTVLRCREEP